MSIYKSWADGSNIGSKLSRPEIGLHKKVNLWTLKSKPSTNI
jgi:hypothetical protein